jgi:hypothetical protein
MADQASVKPRARPSADGHGDGIVGEVAGLGDDIATLAELQARLAALDARESGRKAVIPLVAICVAVVLALAAFTVGLLGAADFLARAASIGAGSAMLITASITLGIAVATILVSAFALKVSVAPFRRSTEELARNLAWIRTVFLYSGRAVPRRG